MKVLEKGRPQQGWAKECICTGRGNGEGGCGAKLLVEKDDVFDCSWVDMYDDIVRAYVFRCPECEVLTTIPKDCVPFKPGTTEKRSGEQTHEQGSIVSIIRTVDIAVVVAKHWIVLIKRAKPPFMDKLVLPGGHVDLEDADHIRAAARELDEEIGIRVDPSRLQFLTFLDAPGRDPRPGVRVSDVFVLYLDSMDDLAGCKAATDAASIHVREISSLTPDEIGFDHFVAIKLIPRVP